MRLKKNVRMTLLYLAFVVIGVVMVFPFIWMIATSFKTGTDIYSLSLLPKKFTLDNYREVLAGSDFPRWFLNSFLVAGITTLSVLVFDPLLGYAFCKYRFRGKEAIFTMLLSTMMIPTEMMIISWYMMVNQLGWNNTYWSMLFPGLSSAFGIFLMRQFFTGVPDELLDAGRIERIWSIYPNCPAIGHPGAQRLGHFYLFGELEFLFVAGYRIGQQRKVYHYAGSGTIFCGECQSMGTDHDRRVGGNYPHHHHFPDLPEKDH